MQMLFLNFYSHVFPEFQCFNNAFELKTNEIHFVGLLPDLRLQTLGRLLSKLTKSEVDRQHIGRPTHRVAYGIWYRYLVW